MIDFSKDVESLSDVEVDSEMTEIRSSDGYLGKGTFAIFPQERQKYLDRSAALYSKKYPETESRRAELPENQPFHDELRKQGFVSGEEIEKLGEAEREALVDQGLAQETDEALSALRSEWGINFNQNMALLKDAEAHLLGSPENQAWLYDSGSGRDPAFIRKFHDLMNYCKEKYGLEFKKDGGNVK